MSALCTGRLYPPGNIPGTHFCWRLSQPQGHSAAGRIMSMKNSNDTVGNRTRDLPACSAVHQPTAPPRTLQFHCLQLQGHVTLARLGGCYQTGGCEKSRARGSVCFCCQSGGGANIGLLQSHDLSRGPTKRSETHMRAVTQNDGAFVDVILLYISGRVRGGKVAPV